jgi:hypothetical protein
MYRHYFISFALKKTKENIFESMDKLKSAVVTAFNAVIFPISTINQWRRGAISTTTALKIRLLADA